MSREEIEKLEFDAIEALNKMDSKRLNDIADRILELEPDNFKAWFYKGVPPRSSYNMDDTYGCWTKALDLTKTKDEIHQLYYLVIGSTVAFFRRISEKKWVFDGRNAAVLSAGFYHKMQSFSPEEVPPVLLMDLAKEFEKEFVNVKKSILFAKMNTNCTTFYNVVLMYANGPTEIMEVCRSFIAYSENIVEAVRKNKIKLIMDSLVVDAGFYKALLAEVMKEVQNNTPEHVKFIDDFWRAKKGTNMPRDLFAAKKEQNNSMPFSGTRGDMKVRDDMIRSYVRDMFDMNDLW